MPTADPVPPALRDHADILPSPIPGGVDAAAANGGDDDHQRVVNCLNVSQNSDSVKIVGLGEATHGTRECFQQKARCVRALITEAGYRTVAFEADAAASAALDAYVRDDNTFAAVPTDAASALAALDMWQWQTETVRNLLRWLREFNADRASAEQVRVHGVDLSTPAAPGTPLQQFFQRVDPGAAARDALGTIAETTVPADDEQRDRTLDAVVAAARTLAEQLDQNSTAERSTSSAAAWNTARHYCRVVEQAAEWARVRHEQPGPHPAGMAARDRFMAENARWALEQDTGEGVALWAHDGHVQRGSFDDGTPWADTTTMGERLAADLGDGYRPVGFDFARGSFRAVGAESGAVETFTVGDPADESTTATLASVAERPYVLDLRSAATDDRLSSWCTETHRTRYVGSVFDPESGDDAAEARTNLPASFDCLLYVPESTPTRPLDAV